MHRPVREKINTISGQGRSCHPDFNPESQPVPIIRDRSRSWENEVFHQQNVMLSLSKQELGPEGH